MFEALKQDVAVETVIPVVDAIGLSFEDALSEVAELCLEIVLSGDSDDSERLEETLENLVSLESAVTQFGLSRALVAFANQNGALSTAIPTIPSLEAMTADLTVDKSAAAIEGIGTTVKSVAKAYVASVVYVLTHHFKAYNQAEARIVVWKHLIDGIETNLKGLHFSAEKAETVHSRVLPYHEMMELLNAYTGAPKALLALWSTELPKDEAAFGPWMNKIRSEVGSVFKTEEAKINDKGKLSIPLRRYFLLKLGEKGSLKEKGYDSDACIHEVIGGFRKLMQAFLSLKTLEATAKRNIDKLTEEGEELDRTVTNRALVVCKNLTQALLTSGLWGVSGAAFSTIVGLRKAYVKEAPETHEEPALAE